jgi:hypothetical protein
MKRRYFYFNDKLALEKFKLHIDANEEEANNQEVVVNYADRARKKQKVNTVGSKSAYMDLKWVKPTSNCCERSFSGARLILTDYRKSMTPYNFECVMQLKYNHEYWDVSTVAKSI